MKLRFHAGVVLVAAVLLGVSAVHSADERREKPFDLGTRETVRVRLVTVDVMVTDRKERSVPDLVTDDFELRVDGNPVKVDTLDLTCPAGAAEGPRAGRIQDWNEPPSDGAPRRIVLAFDYLHLPQLPCPFPTESRCKMHTEVLRALERSLRNLPQGNEEIMVAVLDGALRVEQTFTRDRGLVIEALERMDSDITLWAGHFDHVTEKPLFNGLETLVNLLDIVPGSKALVLFTGGPGPGDTYDPDFRRLTDLASLARVTFYPIDCVGLGIPFR